jgi:hypothetical protein
MQSVTRCTAAVHMMPCVIATHEHKDDFKEW